MEEKPAPVSQLRLAGSRPPGGHGKPNISGQLTTHHQPGQPRPDPPSPCAVDLCARAAARTGGNSHYSYDARLSLAVIGLEQNLPRSSLPAPLPLPRPKPRTAAVVSHRPCHALATAVAVASGASGRAAASAAAAAEPGEPTRRESGSWARTLGW